jgi:protein transport protein SEC24
LNFFLPAGSHVPPPAWGDFVIEDTGAGNCNPRYLRSSLYHVPCNKDVLKETHVPLALSLSPFAQHRADLGERRVELCADFAEDGPPRCSRCRAYVNPFAKWTDR